MHVACSRPRDLAALTAAQDDTIAAVRAGAAVITKAVLFDGRLLGFADFLIRQRDGL